MKQVMNYHKDNGLLNMIRRTDPMINRELENQSMRRWHPYCRWWNSSER